MLVRNQRGLEGQKESFERVAGQESLDRWLFKLISFDRLVDTAEITAARI